MWKKRLPTLFLTLLIVTNLLPSVHAATEVKFVDYGKNTNFDLSKLSNFRTILKDISVAMPALTDQNSLSQINALPTDVEIPGSCGSQETWNRDLQAVIKGTFRGVPALGFLQTNRNLPLAFNVTYISTLTCEKLEQFTIEKTSDYWIKLLTHSTPFVDLQGGTPAHFAAYDSKLIFSTKSGDLYFADSKVSNISKIVSNISNEPIDFNSNHPGVKSILADAQQILVAIATNSSGCNRLELFKLSHAEENILNKKMIYKMPGCFNATSTDLNGSGGRMTWVNDSHSSVYLSIGMADVWRGDESTPPNSNFGVINKIDLTSGRSTLISKGHRNPQGLCVTSQGGVLMETEQGPEGGDELNLIRQNGNYGWPFTSWGYPYADFPYTPPGRSFGSHTGPYIPPIFSWIPSIAASSLVCPSNLAPTKWQNYYLMGTLRDQSIHLLNINTKAKALAFDERIFLGDRIRDLAWISSGSLAVLTDSGFYKEINFLER